MKILNAVAASVLVLFGMALAPSMKAQSTFHRTTHVTFSGPVQIPGKTLPAGEYTLQLNLLPGNETNLVEIRTGDNTKAIATVLTIPDYRLTPTGKTVLMFRESATDAPAGMRAWFYPGENYGHEFVYPMRQAREIAKANNTKVPAVADNTSDSYLGGAQVTEVTPSGSEEQVPSTPPAATASTESQNTQASNNDQANYSNNSSNNNLVASNQPLPKTASSIYSVAFAGGLFLTAGLFVRVLRRRVSGKENLS